MSFSNAHSFEKRIIGNEILLKDGRISLKWDSIRYYFDVDFNDICDHRDGIFLHFFIDKKERENCYEKGSEKFFLFEKIVKNKKKSEITRDVRISKKISSDRKEQIISYLALNNEVINQSIIYQVNLDNYKKYYSQSFREKNHPFVSLVNRLNILIYREKYTEVLNVLEVFFRSRRNK